MEVSDGGAAVEVRGDKQRNITCTCHVTPCAEMPLLWISTAARFHYGQRYHYGLHNVSAVTCIMF
jgi:hypothetical protein